MRYSVGLEDGDDFLFGEVEAEGFHGDFEFVVVYAFVFVEVEEAELYHALSKLFSCFPLLGLEVAGRTASFISSLCSSVSWLIGS